LYPKTIKENNKATTYKDRNAAKNIHMKTVSCREAGFDCDHVVKGETEEEVMKNGAEHAMKVHGMKEEDMTPEMQQKIRGLIRSS
jgi:predicted small metal-binding protein